MTDNAISKVPFFGLFVSAIGKPESGKHGANDQRGYERTDARNEKPVGAGHAAASRSLRSSGAGKSVVLRDLPWAAASLSISG
jgi:hypothetical protein